MGLQPIAQPQPVVEKVKPQSVVQPQPVAEKVTPSDQPKCQEQSPEVPKPSPVAETPKEETPEKDKSPEQLAEEKARRDALEKAETDRLLKYMGGGRRTRPIFGKK